MKRNIALAYFSRPVKGTPDAEVAAALERELLAHACAERGWTPEWYERGRKGWKALTAQLGRPDVAAIVAPSLARLNRDRRVLADLLSQCARLDITVVFVAEGLDTSDDKYRGVFDRLKDPGMFLRGRARRAPAPKVG